VARFRTEALKETCYERQLLALSACAVTLLCDAPVGPGGLRLNKNGDHRRVGSADVLLKLHDDGLDLRRGKMVGKLETERHHHMVRPELKRQDAVGAFNTCL